MKPYALGRKERFTHGMTAQINLDTLGTSTLGTSTVDRPSNLSYLSYFIN